MAITLIAFFLNWFYFELHNILLIFIGSIGGIISLQHFVITYINENGKIGKLLSYIGRCSLGIYVLHYFFIPNLYNFPQSLLTSNNSFIWILSLASVIAIPIVAASIFLYKTIESNRWLYLIMFGKKFNK